MQKQTIDQLSPCPIAMRRGGRPFALLTVQERRVVTLVRSAYATAGPDLRFLGGAVSDGLCAILERLALAIHGNGIVVFGPKSQFVSDDELAILSWLSMLQRPSQSAQWHMANPFQQALRCFADRLVREERRLPARSILAEGRIEHNDCFRIELLPDAVRDTVLDAGAKGVEARAIALVERYRFATASQFRAIGISTQKLSRLCRRGYVERVALGLYKKPDASGAMLAS